MSEICESTETGVTVMINLYTVLNTDKRTLFLQELVRVLENDEFKLLLEFMNVRLKLKIIEEVKTNSTAVKNYDDVDYIKEGYVKEELVEDELGIDINDDNICIYENAAKIIFLLEII